MFYDQFRTQDGHIIPLGRRNTAYFFDRAGVLSDVRYDKIHLVPFGETIPFRTSAPGLYKLLLSFSPYDYDYTVQPGEDDALTVFNLPGRGETASGRSAPISFVPPICFEDADPRLVARMFRSDISGVKRAQLIVNITNDGWFYQPQLSQHLQIARFRSIENRVPTARSVNTGISAFIDSSGRIIERLAGNVDGTLAHAIPLDGRVSVYTRYGDWFAALCAIITGVTALWYLVNWRRNRRRSFDAPSVDVR